MDREREDTIGSPDDAAETRSEPFVAEVVAGVADEEGAAVVAAVADETGVQAVGAAVTDYANTVLVAEFAHPDAAKAAHLGLQMAELSGEVRVDGVLVVHADAAGRIHVDKMTDHSTKTGLKWGAVGGLVVGVLFPPSIIASTVGWGILGGAIGKIRNMVHHSRVEGQLQGSIRPGHSGIVALMHATDVATVEGKLADTTNVTTVDVDAETAREITEEAKAAAGDDEGKPA